MNQEQQPRLSLAAIVLLGLALLAPTLTTGFYVDDYLHQLVLDHPETMAPIRPWSLYDFGTRADWMAADNLVGTLPWWTGEGWRVRFLRPVTSLFLAAQHAVFGGHALGYHLVGLGLFALLIVLVHGLFRSLGLSVRAARTGALLFAVCDSAVLPVGWPANSNSLCVALCSVGALRMVLPGPGRVRPAAAIALAVLALFAKEAGAVTLLLTGVALGLHARRERDPHRRRGLAITAAVAFGLLIAHAVVWTRAGFGTHSLFYATPWENPVGFAANVAVLFGAGFVSLIGPFPLDVLTPFPAAKLPVALVGLAIGLPLVAWVGSRVRGLPGAGWLLTWTVAFLLVQAGAPPADRLLFVPAMGAAGLLALFFEASARAPSPRRGVRIGTRALWVTATCGSGLYLLVQGAGISGSAEHLREVARGTDVGPREVGHRDLFVLQAESQVHAFSLATMWAFEANDHDLAFWPCQIGNRPVRWTRIDERSFDLESLGTPFLTNTFERVYLTEEPRFAVGDRWVSARFEVEAMAVESGSPLCLRFHLRRSLDDPAVRFLVPEGGRLVAQVPPRVGESRVLKTPERSGPFMP